MVYLICVLIYLFILGTISVYKSKQVKSQEDFAVAGRSLSPWVMVCTMLAVWIGTGSIVGNAEKTYFTGMAAFLIPLGGFFGMIVLSQIASRARKFEAYSVPEIIGSRFGQIARSLAVVALIIAYMVITSYQFNAGGAVLEVIAGNKEAVAINVGDEFTRDQVRKGRLVFTPQQNVTSRVSLSLKAKQNQQWSNEAIAFNINVVEAENIIAAKNEAKGVENALVIKQNNYTKIIPGDIPAESTLYRVESLPENGTLQLVEPILTAKKATVIAALFIVAFTMFAGLKSLVSMDVITGSVITVTLFIVFPIYWVKAGGFSGMQASFAAMSDKGQHMQLFGVYSKIQLVNYLLPIFLLVMGDANMYQRIFASKNAKGAKQAVTMMVVVAFTIELLIIACAWTAASMTPDPQDGKYILIYAAKNYLPLPLGCLFLVTVVGIIVSTADSFLLVPATTFIKDVYLNFINPDANEKKIVFLSRMMVLLFGVIAYFVSRAFAESTGFFAKALYAYTIYGAAITPCLIAALFWKGATKQGAIVSILSGTILTLLWGEVDFIRNALPGISQLDAVLPAITISVVSLVVVSLWTKNKTVESAT